jgi:transcriptional regulator with PAS, ATPase and Fis domain
VQLSEEFGRPAPELTSESFAHLAGYDWPGNMREVRNAVERALIFHRSGPLVISPPTTVDHPEGETAGVTIPFGVGLDEVERLYLKAILERHADGELNQIASQLGISRKTLWEKRRRYQL